ncbi:MAG: septum formation initiator family protein [Thermacetogeniaceae bacterium]|nr:septum formation initiator family protein [Syntrophomonadaceae bacterium]
MSWKKNKNFNSRQKKAVWKRRFICLALIFCGVCLLLLPVQLKIWKLKGDLKDYQLQEKELMAKRKEIIKQIEYYSSDAYVEERAREELGLVKPGEVPIRDAVPGRVQIPDENAVIGD